LKKIEWHILRKIKLKWRVFGFLLGFCLLLLIILWLFQVVLLNNSYRQIRISEIRNYASIIISHINNEDILRIVTDLSEDGDFIADIVNLEGRSVLMRSRQISQNVALDNIARALENGGEFYEYSTTPPISENRFQADHQSGNRPLLYYRMFTESLIYVKVADNRAVTINAVISPVNATVTALRYQLYMISVIMLTLAILLAIIIAKWVSKPIEEISRSALNLAKGNYNTRFSGKGFYEIEELSETLNTTAIELGKTETLRRELLANVSHDLRTPLSLIYSYAEMMHDFPGDISEDLAVVIMEETKRLSGLVDDVLDISKLEANMEKLHTTRFNLTKSLGETIERLGELLRDQGYEISFIHDAYVFINADETKINRAFYNLLVNAVNYAGDDRKVSVVQTTTNTGLKISVTDNGEGISKNDLPFIWDRYYKGSKTHKRPVAGTGLGLSIVKKIIKLHGGEYGVISEIGKGSTFWFELKNPDE
jgi:signal transduction histidine kinase